MSPVIEYDDLFIYAPSALLTEGKAIGTAAQQDLTLAQHMTGKPDWNLKKFAKERQKGQTVGKRKLKEVQVRVKDKLLDLIADYQTGSMQEDEFKKATTRAMKGAWKDVFLAGVRAGGVKGAGSGKGKVMVNLAADKDDTWLKSAMAHEMRFLNKFVAAVVDETYKMPLERRTQMYVNALSSFYESARVIALPPNISIQWAGPGDKKTCPSCEYMFANNPFTKATLPTTPRSGSTICLCLTNCRVDIQTRNGIMPLSDVKAGDEVVTHFGRFRRVLAVHTNASVNRHRFAVLVTRTGRLVGLTSDHLCMTTNGWRSAKEVSDAGACVSSGVWDNVRTEKQDGVLPLLWDGSPMERATRHTEEACYSSGRQETKSQIRGLVANLFHLVSCRWQTVCEVLGWRYRPLRFALQVAMGTNARSDTRGFCDSPQRWRLYERRPVELGNEAISETRFRPRRRASEARLVESLSRLRHAVQDYREACARWARRLLLTCLCGRRATEPGMVDVQCVREGFRDGGIRSVESKRSGVRSSFLLSNLLQRAQAERNEDPCVRLLRDEVYASGIGTQEVEVGQVLLLQGTLPDGTLLYDLTVEEDHSFIIEGHTLHNSNCRDKLLIRRVTPGKAAQITEDSQFNRNSHIRNLRKIKRLGYF